MFRSEGFVVQDFNIDDYNEALEWFLSCVEDIENEISFDAQPDTFYCLNEHHTLPRMKQQHRTQIQI